MTTDTEELGQNMSERTTPDVTSGDKNRLPETNNAGYSMATQHQHTQVQADIFIYGADSVNPTYMGCFGRTNDESAASIEERWNAYAEQMWRFGVEPVEDEPFYTVVEDGVIWDHYVLQEIHNYVQCEDGCRD